MRLGTQGRLLKLTRSTRDPHSSSEGCVHIVTVDEKPDRHKAIKVLVIFGTRPEAIKLAPVISKLHEEKALFRVRCCSTSQHRDLLRPVLDAFSIVPDYELEPAPGGESLPASFARILSGL